MLPPALKPDDRSLNIVVVGLGQAGGNLAAELYRCGYSAVALNTASTDLSALDEGGIYPSLPAERRLYIGLDGYDGAGADPGYGQECIHEHADRIRAAVMKQAAEADVVVIAAGLGGGTGSSVAELLHVLEGEDLPMVALLTIPTEGESGLAKVNAVRAINAVMDASLLGWIFVDNGRMAALNTNVSIVEYFAHINQQIVAPLDALNRLNARPDVRPIRSFDGEDFRKLLLAGGVLNYAEVELPQVTTEEVVGAIRDALETSDIMPAGFDIKRLSYCGVVIEAPETALAAAPMSTFEEIAEILKDESEGAAIYYGLYCAPANQPTMLRVLASTSALPHRIREVLSDAKREGMLLGEKVQEKLPTLELGELGGVELFKTRTRPSERPRRTRGSAAPRRPEPPDEASSDAPRARPPSNEAPDGQARSSGRRARRPGPRSTTETPARRNTPPENRSRSRRLPPQNALAQPAKPPSPVEIEEPGTDELHLTGKLEDIEDSLDMMSSDMEGTNGVGVRPTEIRPKAQGPSLPEQYDRLVAEFLNAEDTARRDQIADRLENDAIDEDPAIRYYAVEAMAKLGPKTFGNALLEATEDEDEAVRRLAVEALKG